MKKTTPLTVLAESSATTGYTASAAAERPGSKRRASQPHKRSPSGASRKAHENGDDHSELDAEAVLSALVAFKKGNFSVRLPLTWTGVSGKVADTFNEVAELMSHQTDELSRISRVVGKEGRIQERLSVGHVSGAWSERVDSVNNLID